MQNIYPSINFNCKFSVDYEKKVLLTVSEADQDVSPLSENAVHVYRPESSRCKSEKGNRNEYKITESRKYQW